jgi:hypothetical protein
MESFSENVVQRDSNGFFQYITTFDTKVKNDLLNMMQYTLMIILPIVLMDKGITDLFSSDIDNKNNVELAFEVIGEVTLLIIGMYYSHRLVCYVPTYSGEPYTNMNFTSVLFMFVVIVFTFQTTLRSKVDILLDRLYEYVFGISGFEPIKNNKNTQAKQQTQPQSQPQQHQETMMNQLQQPQPPSQSQPQPQPQSQPQRQSQETKMNTFEPIAANEVFSLNAY